MFHFLIIFSLKIHDTIYTFKNDFTIIFSVSVK